MPSFQEGERVRVDIPDKEDPDFRYHRETGEVIAVLQDGADSVTGDVRDASLFRVELDSGETVDLRWRDLRPADET